MVKPFFTDANDPLRVVIPGQEYVEVVAVVKREVLSTQELLFGRKSASVTRSQDFRFDLDEVEVETIPHYDVLE